MIQTMTAMHATPAVPAVRESSASSHLPRLPTANDEGIGPLSGSTGRGDRDDRSRDERIRDEAIRFREAIEACGPDALGLSFEQFPLGACGDATPLLGTYLTEQGFGPFQYVLGECQVMDGDGTPQFQSHAWLEQDGLTVDITPDQFHGVPESVIVSRDPHGLHKRFTRSVKHRADYRIYDAPTATRLGPIYNRILEAMTKTS